MCLELCLKSPYGIKKKKLSCIFGHKLTAQNWTIVTLKGQTQLNLISLISNQYLQQLAPISDGGQILKLCTRYRRHIPPLHIWVYSSGQLLRLKVFSLLIPQKSYKVHSVFV